MRVNGGKPVTLQGGETGWVHRLVDGPRPVYYQKPEKEVTIDAAGMISRMRGTTLASQVAHLADSLGVDTSSVTKLHSAYSLDDKAWAFPMRDGYGKIIGIRLRDYNGKKWAVKGSHAGIFYEDVIHADRLKPSLICEGPTDTLAGMTLGYFCIGRPSCSGGLPHIVTLVRRLHIAQVAIISDNDGPGMVGAKLLMDALDVSCCILVLPCKDLREFVKLGGSSLTLGCLINGAVWQRKKNG